MEHKTQIHTTTNTLRPAREKTQSMKREYEMHACRSSPPSFPSKASTSPFSCRANSRCRSAAAFLSSAAAATRDVHRSSTFDRRCSLDVRSRCKFVLRSSTFFRCCCGQYEFIIGQWRMLLPKPANRRPGTKQVRLLVVSSNNKPFAAVS